MEDNEIMETTETTEETGLQEDLVEEVDDAASIEEALTEETNTDGGNQDGQQGTGGQKEPGYVKQRIDKAVQKAVAETEARMQALFDQQMAPFREQMLQTEAQELVRSGKVKDLETAKELVRYRQGQAQPQQQPRNEQGQFASRERQADAGTQARIEMLQHQADRIKGQNGPDVIAEFQSNEETKQKVVSGEWDFYDVAEYLKGQKPQSKKIPAPMRSPNGASGREKSSIASMTDEQFEKFEKRVKGGARYTLK